MSTLTSQCNELRTTAVRLERMMRGEFDAISLSSIPPILRHAADTIESLRNRLTDTCHIAVHDNLSETDGRGDVWLECGACHWQMPLEPGTPKFAYCPNCGRKVVG